MAVALCGYRCGVAAASESTTRVDRFATGKHRVDHETCSPAAFQRRAGSLAEATLQAYKDGPRSSKSGAPTAEAETQ
jgi:hypothetical protein